MKNKDSFLTTIYEMSNMNLPSESTKMEIKSVSNHNKENLLSLKTSSVKYLETTTKKA